MEGRKIKKQAQKILPFLLVATLFFILGTIWQKRQPTPPSFNPEDKTKGGETGTTLTVFPKSKKPKVEFFVMSFCPFGNQAEEALYPVWELLGSKVDWQPRYVYYNQDYCQNMLYDPTRCQKLVDQGYFPNLEACKQRFFSTLDDCLRRFCLRSQPNQAFCSLHGRGELNQDLRERCLWQALKNKKLWWEFTLTINRECRAENADTCWQSIAEKVGINPQIVVNCINQKGKTLLLADYQRGQQLKADASPMIFINGVLYQERRTPEAYKQAICSAFTNPPPECQTKLRDEIKQTQGGCG